MTTHELKVWKPYYQDISDKRKKFEVRINDRGFRVGDIVYLNEFEPYLNSYTGRSSKCIIRYILDDPKFCKEGYIIFSFTIIKEWAVRFPNQEDDE